jgi:glycosyltransferase involved in cell wall biosynthesis
VRIVHVRDVANVASTLVEGLRAEGHEAELLRIEAAGGRLPLPLKALFLPARLIEGARANRAIKRGRYDIVHIHVAYMGWLGIIGRYPYVLHTHGQDTRANLRHPLKSWITRRALEKARLVFYSTPDLGPVVHPVRPDAVFLPNPVDTERFRPSGKPPGERPRVLIMSRLDRIKGIDKALAVAARLRALVPDVHVDAFAWGEMQDEVRDAGVNLVPTVPYDEMPDLLNRYHVAIGQFHLGILSMSELEAMACGVPLVGEFRYPDVYDAQPPLIADDDPEGIAQQIAALLRDYDALSARAEEGRAWTVTHHDYLHVTRALLEHYTKLVPAEDARPVEVSG